MSGSPARPVVVLTRAEADNVALARRLDDRGLDSLSVPMIAIQPPADSGNALEAAVAGLDHYHWVVITSANGVHAVAETLATVDREWPAHLRLAVVGPATALAAKAEEWPVDFMPSRSTAVDLVTEFDPPATVTPPVRVLAPLGDLAGPALRKGLAKRGYQVDQVIAYRSVVPDPGPDGEGELADLVADASAIAFTSSSTATRFVTRFGMAAVPPVVVCIGPRAAGRARQLGLTVQATAQPFTEDGLIEALVAKLL